MEKEKLEKLRLQIKTHTNDTTTCMFADEYYYNL